MPTPYRIAAIRFGQSSASVEAISTFPYSLSGSYSSIYPSIYLHVIQFALGDLHPCLSDSRQEIVLASFSDDDNAHACPSSPLLRLPPAVPIRTYVCGLSLPTVRQSFQADCLVWLRISQPSFPRLTYANRHSDSEGPLTFRPA